jgi:thiamine kinase-like enzyme
MSIEMLEDHLSPDQLSADLSKKGVQVQAITRLDLNVYHIDVASQRSLVARVYPEKDGCNVLAIARLLARLLNYLQLQNFPAERCASLDPVSKLEKHSGCVMLTQFASGHRPERNRAAFGRLGKLLGRLHTVQVPNWTAEGGAWHHLSPTGGIGDECNAASRMLRELQKRGDTNADYGNGVSRLVEELHRLEASLAHAPDLPIALVHPDLVPSNAIVHAATPLEVEAADHGNNKEEEWTIVDWTGAGVGPRIVSLGFLLAVAGARGKTALVDAVMKGYSSHVELEEVELEKLPQAVYCRLLTIQYWEVAVGRKEAGTIVNGLPDLVEMGENVARRVREVVWAD